jgi:hypothetical protein
MLNEEKHRVIREKETELNLRHQLVTSANPMRPSVYLKSDYSKRAPKKTAPGITEWSSREKLSRDVSRELKKDSSQIWYGRQADYSPDKHCNRHNHHSSKYQGSIDLGTPSFDNTHKEVKRSKPTKKSRDKLSKSVLTLTSASQNHPPSAVKRRFNNNTPELTPKKKIAWKGNGMPTGSNLKSRGKEAIGSEHCTKLRSYKGESGVRGGRIEGFKF